MIIFLLQLKHCQREIFCAFIINFCPEISNPILKKNYYVMASTCPLPHLILRALRSVAYDNIISDSREHVTVDKKMFACYSQDDGLRFFGNLHNT